jgi:hypothetical protein
MELMWVLPMGLTDLMIIFKSEMIRKIIRARYITRIFLLREMINFFL